MLILLRILTILILFYPLILLINYSDDDFTNYLKIDIDWYHNVEKNILLKNFKNKSHKNFNRNYFFNKKQLVYYNPDGQVLHKINIDSKTLVAADQQYYTVSPKTGSKIELFNNTGERLWSLDTYSIPFITPFKKNIVLMSSDNNSITVYNYNRNLILSQSYLGSLITDYEICRNNDSVVFGNIEGDIHFFDYSFKSIFKKTYTESKYNYVKSVGCSYSGEYIVAIAGLYPEKKLVFDKSGNLLWSEITHLDRRTRTDLYVDDKNQIIFDSQPNHIKAVSLLNGELIKEIPFPSSISPVTKTISASTIDWIVLGVNGTDNILFVFNRELKLIWQTTFSDEYLTHSEINQIKNQLFVKVHTLTSIYNYQITLP